MAWEVLLISLVLILLSPTTSTVSSGPQSTLLAFLMSLLSHRYAAAPADHSIKNCTGFGTGTTQDVFHSRGTLSSFKLRLKTCSTIPQRWSAQNLRSWCRLDPWPFSPWSSSALFSPSRLWRTSWRVGAVCHRLYAVISPEFMLNFLNFELCFLTNYKWCSII